MSSDDESICVRRKSKKCLAILDDPEDGEPPEFSNVNFKQCGTDSDSDGKCFSPSYSTVQKSKMITNADSDDDSDNAKESSYKNSSRVAKKPTVINTGFDDNIDNKDDSSNKNSSDLAKKSVIDSDYESDNSEEFSKKTPSWVAKKFTDTNIYDAEGSSDEDKQFVCEDIVKSTDGKKSGRSKSRNGPRKRDDKEGSSLDEVHSEAQRLVRQSRVSLPYHMPRQQPLNHFLKRRLQPRLPLVRTSADCIKQLWEHLEEKEKEAEILYKSESEDEIDRAQPAALEETLKKRLTLVDRTVPEQTEQYQPQQTEEEKQENSQNLNLTGGTDNSPRMDCSKPSEKNEDEAPKIRTPPGEVIELVLDGEEEITETPVDSFIKRFAKHAAIKQKKVQEEKQVEISIMRTEYNTNGEVVKLCEESVNVRCGGESVTKTSVAGGGSRLAALRTTLKQAMAQERHQRLERHKLNYQLNEENFEDEELIDDEELEPSDKENSIKNGLDGCGVDNHSDENVDDEEEEEEYCSKKKKNDYSKIFMDNEAEVSDTGNSEDDREDGDGSGSLMDNDGSGSEVDKSDDSDGDDNGGSENDNELLDDTLQQLSQDGSFNESFFKSDKEAEDSLKEDNKLSTPTDNELMALCSGKFDSQSFNISDLETDGSQNFKLKFSEEQVSQEKVKMIDSSRRILDSSDEEDLTIAENKIKKKRRKLQFSDDEEDNSVSSEEASFRGEYSEDEDGVHNTNNVQEEEDVMDEEEEFLSREKKEVAASFFDEQAELSGSEYEGSADEDEEGLDMLEDTDEADREVIDQAKLKRQLGQFHIKDMLAEDNREIRLLKELLLEDGELHSDGPKRQRLYRWSNQPGDDVDKKWSVIDGVDEAKYEEDNGEEEEDEASWRKDRLNRQTFLQQNSSKIEDEDKNELEPKVVIGGRLAKRTSLGTPVIPPGSAYVPAKQIAPSPDPKNPFTLRTNRGSFLSRGQQVLSRLATLSGGDSGTGPMVKPTRRNMVFAVVSPPKQNADSRESETMKDSKRKSSFDDSTSLRIIKKLKFADMSTEEQCISVLERLRRSDIIT